MLERQDIEGAETDIAQNSPELVIEETRRQIFGEVLARGGQLTEENQPAGIDLRNPIDVKTEIRAKEGAVEARDVVLEQARIVAILKNKFKHLREGDNLNIYCTKLGIGDGVKEDLRNALPGILSGLEKPLPDIFRGDMAVEDYEDELIYDFLKGDLETSLLRSAELNKAVGDIIDFEIDLALVTLSESRKYPVLAHRVRGFSKTEASEKGLRKALEENVAEMEFDIRMSGDGRAMIHHNATLGESCGRTEKVHDFTAAELNALPMKNDPENHIITLRQFFEMLKATGNETTKVNIDIKDFNPEMLDEILELIKEYKAHHRAVIVSWLPQALQYLYEKDPTLPYSMSYFPILNTPVTSQLLRLVGNVPSGSHLFGRFATWFAKKRAKNIQKGLPGAVQTAGSEMITDAVVLDANQHHSAMSDVLKAQRGTRDLVSAHTIPIEKKPLSIAESDPDKMDIMARVLHNGSVNVMAIPEDKLPKNFIGRWLINLIRKGKTRLREVCEKNDIKVNLFDLTSEEEIRRVFDESKVESGVVYSSNPGAVRRLDTRE